MKLTKIITFTLIFAISVLCLASCSITHIEDTNGASTLLNTITEGQLFAKTPKYIENNALYIENGNVFRYKAEKLSGVRSVAKFRADGEQLTISTSIILSSGNCRAVLMNDGEYVADIAFGEGLLMTVANPSGSYEIRLAGESASVNFEFTFSFY